MRRYHSELTLMLHRWVLRRTIWRSWMWRVSPPRPVPFDLQRTYQVLEILRDGDITPIDSPGVFRKRRPFDRCCSRHDVRERWTTRERRDRVRRRIDERQQ